MGSNHQLNQPPRWIGWAAAAIPVIVMTVFVAIPTIVLAGRAFSDLGSGASIDTGRTLSILGETTVQAAVSALLTVGIGLGPGVIVARHRFRGRTGLLSFLTGVFVLPTVVMAAGVRSLLPGSLERGWIPVVIAHVVFNLAVVIRIVGSAPVPTGLEQVARTLGASPRRVLLTVTGRLLAPSIVASGAVVFVLSFTSYGIVRILGGIDVTTIEVEIWRQTIVFGRLDRGVILAIMQIGVLAALGSAWLLIRRRRSALRFEAGTPTPVTRRALVILLPVIGLVVAPLAALAVGSITIDGGIGFSAWTSFGDTQVRPGLDLGIDPLAAILTSARIAVSATAIAVVLALGVTLARAVDHRAGAIADMSVMAPLGVSAVTIGLGILITFNAGPIDWRSHPLMVPVGHALVATPFLVRSIAAATSTVPTGRVDVAATLGATPLYAQATALAPAVIPALATGAGLASAISLGEFGATSLLSRTGSETLPIVIDRLLARTGGDFRARAHALSVLLTAAVMASTIGIERAVARSRWSR